MSFPGADNLENCGFGTLVDLSGNGLSKFLQWAEANRSALLDLFYYRNGLLVLRGASEISHCPKLLVRLSELFGEEVENYKTTITSEQFFHASEDQILVLSNQPPCNFQPPPLTEPECNGDGNLPTRYPQRKGWHTDQSYRRPPPDITLLYGVTCPPPDQAQTIYADGISAYHSLTPQQQENIRGLQGIHAMRWTGRTACEVRHRAPVKPLLPHQLPQKQPLVRVHPVTGNKTLYLCDEGQMDFIDGPIEGMQPGLDGDGHRLLDSLVTHLTRDEFTYVHQWQHGDVVIHDNRNLPHTPTWYDSNKYCRLMWRCTVMGNPGKDYAGEGKSWIADSGITPMQGLEDLAF